MNFEPKYKKIVGIIIVVVAISLLFTGIIVSKLIKETNNRIETHWFFAESVRTGQPVVLTDAYILSNDNGVLKFIYDYTTYEVEGNLAEPYLGVANILVEGSDITKVSIKPDSINDTLMSYTESTIRLKENGELLRNATIPVYKMIDGQVSQVEWNEFIVGVSNVRCIMEEGSVTAILIENEVVPSDIRVVIKNGESIYYPELYIQHISDGKIVNIGATMDANGLQSLELSDGQGFIICDETGDTAKSGYEGCFQVLKTENGMVLINIVPMETYIKYVLPSEMQTNFAHEALKAQAVCARTYAYSQMKSQKYAMYGANLDDSTAFQVYNSFGRYPQTDAAVEETVGEVISCNGKLITCYYFSTGAGVTNDMSSWESTNPDYICMQGMDIVNSLDLSKDVDFSNYMRSDISCFDSTSPMYRWKAILDISDIKESEYGLLKSITIKERNQAGYVTNLELMYENETVTLKNENTIRKVLGYYLQETIQNNENIRTDYTMIPSACFEVVEQSDEKIVLRGGGFGHGIGMSQYGAKSMAEQGYGYKDIIGYYYNDVIVKTL